jgi:hypothetical protein
MSSKQKIIFLMLCLCLPVCCISTIKAQDSIPQKIIPEGKLQWSDFMDEADKNSEYWADTYWYVQYKYNILEFRGDTVIINLNVWPSLKTNSWVLPDKETDELLQHEQVHFDFARLVAFKFKNEAGSTILFKYNYPQKLDSIFNSILTNIMQMEKQYDDETNHMLNKPEQQRWNKKIADMLKEEE